MSDCFSKLQLQEFNNRLLGKGIPNTWDGEGYNKCDYDFCSSLKGSLSNKQCMILAKKLIKYCNTQLYVDKEKMKRTLEHYIKIVNFTTKLNA